MIGKIVGSFCGHYGNIALFDVVCGSQHSIGYEIVMKTDEILSLKEGEDTKLYIKEIIKEDDDVLYGFVNFEDKCWFEELIKLSGLGPKSALAILSTYSCENIENAIMTNNCDFFLSISGIGGKIANRIPHEMAKNIDKIHEKIMNFGFLSSNVSNSKNEKHQTKTLININEDAARMGVADKANKNKRQKEKNNQQDKNIVNDAVEALIALGFAKNQIYNEVFEIVKNNNTFSTEDIIKEFLKKK